MFYTHTLSWKRYGVKHLMSSIFLETGECWEIRLRFIAHISIPHTCSVHISSTDSLQDKQRCLSFNLLKQSISYSCLICQCGLKPSYGFQHLSSTYGWIKHHINEFWMKASQRGPLWLISSYIIDHRIPLRSGTHRSSKMQITGKLSNASLTEHIINKSASTADTEIPMINAAKISAIMNTVKLD